MLRHLLEMTMFSLKVMVFANLTILSMCTKPIVISLRMDDSVRQKRHLPTEVQVPCGHCRECLNKRKNSLTYRCYRQALETPNVFFVTLTYRKETLPISSSVCRVDRETGEVVPINCRFVTNSGKESYRSFELVPRDKIYGEMFFDFYRKYGEFYRKHTIGNKVIFPHPFYYDREIPFSGLDDEYDYFVRFTPSVSRFDVRHWIKNFRERWFKSTGERLNFRYSCCLEYGPKSFRPHAHLMFFGLDESIVKLLCKDWKDMYGFTYIERVKAINEDGSSGYLNVSKYLGKYMTKGKSCECPSAVLGFAECPRMVNSVNLGCNFSEREKSYFYCWDLYGRYDLERPSLNLSPDQLKVVIDEIPKRLMIQLTPNYSIRLPMYYINKVFGRYESYFKKIQKYQIWYLVTESIRDRISTQLELEFKQFCACNSHRPFDEVVFEFDARKKATLQEREKTAQVSYIKSLFKSVF